MEIVQKYLNVNCHGGTVVFHAIPEIPQMAPVFIAVFSAPLDDTPELRMKRYNRRRHDIRLKVDVHLWSFSFMEGPQTRGVALIQGNDL